LSPSLTAQTWLAAIKMLTLCDKTCMLNTSFMNATQSLYEQLGGEAAVNAAVDVFYRKVLADDRINRFFEDTDMDRQIAKQKAFLTMAFGGPVAYTGKDMRAGHARLVAMGLNDSHFDAVVELLGQSL